MNGAATLNLSKRLPAKEGSSNYTHPPQEVFLLLFLTQKKKSSLVPSRSPFFVEFTLV